MFVCWQDGEAVIVDASCHSSGEVSLVADFINEKELTVKKLLLTHGHIDHILGCASLSQMFGMPWSIHPSDIPLVQQGSTQAAMFGVEFDSNFELDHLDPSTPVNFGSTTWNIVQTPGHSPGSVTFVDADTDVLMVGDVIFRGSIGRTDLWQGSYPVLMKSIQDVVLTKKDVTKIFSGHGPQTTVGAEKLTNPFLNQ